MDRKHNLCRCEHDTGLPENRSNYSYEDLRCILRTIAYPALLNYRIEALDPLLNHGVPYYRGTCELFPDTYREAPTPEETLAQIRTAAADRLLDLLDYTIAVFANDGVASINPNRILDAETVARVRDVNLQEWNARNAVKAPA